jgi:hypothetical protein
MAFVPTKAMIVSTATDPNEPAAAPRFEQHFSIKQLADMWNLSQDSVRRLFLHEPGVVVLQRKRPYRRSYRTLRIPESVAMRVYRRSTILY